MLVANINCAIVGNTYVKKVRKLAATLLDSYHLVTIKNGDTNAADPRQPEGHRCNR
jgi:hypothetical protein